VGVHIDNEALTRLLDERIAATLPTFWPTKGWAWDVRSPSVGNHWPVGVHFLDELPLEQAIEALVESINEALVGYSKGVSEDACEPYGGWVEADGDVLRVRYGRVPFSHPDDGRRAPEVSPIPLSEFVTVADGEL
jgi:hypothetical protein